MDPTAILTTVIGSLTAIVVALIGANHLSQRRSMAPDPAVQEDLRIWREKAQLYREQRDEAHSSLEDETVLRRRYQDALEKERAAHSRTQERLDDCERQRFDAYAELGGIAHRRHPREEPSTDANPPGMV